MPKWMKKKAKNSMGRKKPEKSLSIVEIKANGQHDGGACG